MAEQFGAPPYLVNGEPVKAWAVAVRQGCSGPVTELRGEPVGTLFYCVSTDGKQAWVSAVSLPVGTYFGSAQLFTRAGDVVVGVANARAPEEPMGGPGESEPPPMGEVPLEPTPSWLETPDASR